MASTNGKLELDYHTKLDLVLAKLEQVLEENIELKEVVAEAVEKINNLAIDHEAYGLNYLGRDDN